MKKKFLLKKASFNPWFLILVLLVLGITFGITVLGESVTVDIEPSEQGHPLLQSYSRASGILFFVDTIARHAMEEAIVIFSQNGGLINSSECGTPIGDFVKWNSEDKKCYENSFYDTFYDYAQKSMNTRFDTVNQWSSTRLEKDNYRWYVDDERIVGIAITPTRVAVKSPTHKVSTSLLGVTVEEQRVSGASIGSHYISSSFNVEIENGLSMFSSLQELVKSIEEICVKESDKRTCVERQISSTRDITVGIVTTQQDYYLLEAIPLAKNFKFEKPPYVKIALWVDPMVRP